MRAVLMRLPLVSLSVNFSIHNMLSDHLSECLLHLVQLWLLKASCGSQIKLGHGTLLNTHKVLVMQDVKNLKLNLKQLLT